LGISRSTIRTSQSSTAARLSARFGAPSLDQVRR
jgi:hypothetical protein